MPYIGTKTNITVTPEKEISIKKKLGTAISLLPGKTESWLMLGFEDNFRLWFKGENERPMAFAEVKLLGKASAEAYSALTAKITEIFGEELGIAPTDIYVKYEECSLWGWNGSMF